MSVSRRILNGVLLAICLSVVFPVQEDPRILLCILLLVLVVEVWDRTVDRERLRLLVVRKLLYGGILLASVGVLLHRHFPKTMIAIEKAPPVDETVRRRLLPSEEIFIGKPGQAELLVNGRPYGSGEVAKESVWYTKCANGVVNLYTRWREVEGCGEAQLADSSHERALISRMITDKRARYMDSVAAEARSRTALVQIPAPLYSAADFGATVTLTLAVGSRVLIEDSTLTNRPAQVGVLIRSTTLHSDGLTSPLRQGEFVTILADQGERLLVGLPSSSGDRMGTIDAKAVSHGVEVADVWYRVQTQRGLQGFVPFQFVAR